MSRVFLIFYLALKVRMSCTLFYKTLECGIREVQPEENKTTFDEYMRARADLSDMNCEEDFVAGYQLGVRMMMAGLDAISPPMK